jgi:hypothetical protein
MFSAISNALRKLDAFSEPVCLTFKKQSDYKTSWGGILSILVSGILAFYLHLLLSQPIEAFSEVDNIVVETKTMSDSGGPSGTTVGAATYSKVTRTKEEVSFMEQAAHTGTFNALNYGFSYAICPDFTIDSTAMEIGVNIIVSNGGSWSLFDQPFAKCNSTTFPMKDYSRAEKYGIAECYWMNYSFIPLRGDLFVNGSMGSRIYIKKWTGSNCKDETSATNFFDGKNVRILALGKYYNSSGTDDRLEEYIHVHPLRIINYDEVGETFIRLSPHEVTYLNKSTSIFFSIEEVVTQSRKQTDEGIHYVYAVLGNKWFSHEQYEEYTIDSVSSSRMLGSTTTTKETTEEKTSINLYYIIFVGSQIGGLAYLLKWAIGIFYSIFAYEHFMLDIVNRFRNSAFKERMTQNQKVVEGESWLTSFKPSSKNISTKSKNIRQSEIHTILNPVDKNVNNEEENKELVDHLDQQDKDADNEKNTLRDWVGCWPYFKTFSFLFKNTKSILL